MKNKNKDSYNDPPEIQDALDKVSARAAGYINKKPSEQELDEVFGVDEQDPPEPAQTSQMDAQTSQMSQTNKQRAPASEGGSPHAGGSMKQRARESQQARAECSRAGVYGLTDQIVINATDTGENETHRDRESWVPFPLETLPIITRNFVIDTARALNVDPAIVAVATLNTAGAAIGARLKLRLGGYDWEAAPILWTAIIGASSMGKTPAMKAPIALLRDKERELAQKYAREMEGYNRANSLHQKVLKKIGSYNDKAIEKEEEGDEEAAEALRQKAANLEQSQNSKPPQKPKERILNISGEFTLQGLIGIAAENPMGFLLHLDELTQLFTSLSNSSNKAAAAQEMLKFFDGTPSRTGYKDAGKNRKAAQCWASILGGAVPSILQGFIKGTQYEKDGLLSRFCLVWAPPIPPEQFTPQAGMTDEKKKLMKQVMETLADFRPDYCKEANEEETNEIKDPHIEEMYRRPKSRFVKLSPEAIAEFNKKRSDLYSQKYSTNQEAKISLLGKSDGVLGRVALIIFILGAAEEWIDTQNKNDSLYPFVPVNADKTPFEMYVTKKDVSLETYRRAELVTQWLVNETETVYKKLGILADDKDLSFILDRLKKCADGANTATIQHWKSSWRDKGKPIIERLLAIGLKKGLWTGTVQTEKNNRACTIYRAVEK